MIRKRLIVMGILVSFLLVGCKNNGAELTAGEFETNTLFVNKDGAIQSAVIEPFEKPYYNADELEEYLQTVTADYNNTAGTEAVKLSSLKVKDKIASAVFDYKGIEDYTALNEVNASFGTLDEMGNLLPDTLLNEDGTEISKSEILQDSKASKYNVLVLNEEYDVRIEGAVKYYANADMMSKESVHTQPQVTSVILYK